MTHGDQAKAKAAKTSQTSGIQKSSSKAAGKQQGGKGSQGGGQQGSEGSQGAKIALKKQQGDAEKGSPAAAPAAKGASGKDAGNGGKGKGRPAPPLDGSGFSNPDVANAFKRALAKYPNAFRKLTD